MQQIQWQDRFNIGVEIVDQAHRKLFSIVDKMMELYVEKHESRFACVEGIKYFKAYALKHFAEEEAYMREIGYAGYLAHKRHHDRMRRETLPALERELYATNFSTEAVQRFIGVCVGWLTGHILVEDRAITGKTANALISQRQDDELSMIRSVIIHPLQEMFGVSVQFVGDLSPGDRIADAQYYELIYRGQKGISLRFVLIIGERLLLRAAGLLFGVESCAIDDIVHFAIREIAQSLVHRAAACFEQDSEAYRLEEERFLDAGEYVRRFGEHTPQYSLLFAVRRDCFALCIDQIPDPG